MKLRCTAAAAAFTVASLASQGLRLPVAFAGAGQGCRVIEVDFTPSDKLQIVAWLEKTKAAEAEPQGEMQ